EGEGAARARHARDAAQQAQAAGERARQRAAHDPQPDPSLARAPPRRAERQRRRRRDRARSERARRSRELVKRWPELVIAALVIGVVAMLIVPVPRPLLDILLVLNIGIAVALLMAAVFSPRPLGFQSFPTLLVVTTLFRVGLEVSTTRLVLADADAGE